MQQTTSDIGKKKKKKKTIGKRSIYTQTLLTALLEKKDSEILTFNEASKLIGMQSSSGSNGYRYLNSAIRIARNEYSIEFKNVKTIGYKRMTAVPSRARSKKKKNKGGRPTKFEDRYIQMAAVACERLGATEQDLAKLFNVRRETIWSWRKNNKEFAAVVREGKDVFDTETVEKALLQRALGYEYKEDVYESAVIRHDNGKDEVASPATKIKTTIKQVSPDVLAQIFWLKNRQPDRWRDVKGHIIDQRVVHGVIRAHDAVGEDEWEQVASRYRDTVQLIMGKGAEGKENNTYKLVSNGEPVERT